MEWFVKPQFSPIKNNVQICNWQKLLQSDLKLQFVKQLFHGASDISPNLQWCNNLYKNFQWWIKPNNTWNWKKTQKRGQKVVGSLHVLN